MKYDEWKKANGLKTEDDVVEFFRKNLHAGIGQMSISVCPNCDEVLDDYPYRLCPNCTSKNNSE